MRKLVVLLSALVLATAVQGASDPRGGRPEPGVIAQAYQGYIWAYVMQYWDKSPEAAQAFDHATWAYLYVWYAWNYTLDSVLDGSGSGAGYVYMMNHSYTRSLAALNSAVAAYTKNPSQINLTCVLPIQATLSSCSALPNLPAPDDGLNAELRQLRDLHNAYRQASGLVRLRADYRLTNSAQGHAIWMAQNQTLTHAGAGGLQPIQRAANQGYSGRSYSVGENIAFGQITIAEVFNVWVASAPHRTNILNSGFRDIGIGVATASNGQRYWCVDFGVITP